MSFAVANRENRIVRRVSRRGFLCRSAASGLAIPALWLANDGIAGESRSKSDRLVVGCIGNGGMGRGDAAAASRFGDIAALADVDRGRSEALAGNEKIFKGKKKPEIFDDYRKLLDRKDIQIVTISTPDHWHTKIAVDALQAGKDVYCQKPLTLTIDEGKILCRVVRQTGRVLQVGTQQRSENNEMFLKAVAMCRHGRLGKIKRATCVIGGGPKGGPFKKTAPPPGLNWERWLGQAPLVDYIKERCHGSFRWWYEYSGGKLTDWGAHHVDIAQWAIGMEGSGPKTIEPLAAVHSQPLKNGLPTLDDCYNTANTFQILCTFADGTEILIRNDVDNGITFEGEKGKFFVNRGKLTGEPVDRLKQDPISEDALKKLRKGKASNSHMGNFVACVKDRSTPISDVFSHHRALTTCHLANIAIRLGRKLTWDAEKEAIVGDAEANAWLSRPQRKGYQIEG